MIYPFSSPLMVSTKSVEAGYKLDGASGRLLKTAITKLGLSARAYDRILKEVGTGICDNREELNLTASTPDFNFIS